ncbi:MAG TPA: hypothetical protein VFO10_19315 [Oligoflexus sp.]|uniref:hypothetical protein n=1 Tax=Oligoflexus sp. TaxID=1971216 RepID=UPI002D8065B0|nr:hypothetical protein [Oligoflexus sp.]HET9239420.1 hypothetical protein [Oligoflexus sp.]
MSPFVGDDGSISVSLSIGSTSAKKSVGQEFSEVVHKINAALLRASHSDRASNFSVLASPDPDAFPRAPHGASESYGLRSEKFLDLFSPLGGRKQTWGSLEASLTLTSPEAFEAALTCLRKLSRADTRKSAQRWLEHARLKNRSFETTEEVWESRAAEAKILLELAEGLRHVVGTGLNAKKTSQG